jgi:hypothetical protein
MVKEQEIKRVAKTWYCSKREAPSPEGYRSCCERDAIARTQFYIIYDSY